MRLSTLFILFGLLTASTGQANVQTPASPGSGSNLFHSSDDTIQTLERLHAQAEAHIIENDFDKAVQTYLEILMLEPDDDTAYTGLGNCYLVMGQFKKANDAYHNALSIDPENQSAILGIQKIMDPDGVEGMVHPLQVESEQPLLDEIEAPLQAKAAAQSMPVQSEPAKKIIPTQPARPAAVLAVRPSSLIADRMGPEKLEPAARPKSPIKKEKLMPAKPVTVKPITLARADSPKKSSAKQTAKDSADPRSIQQALRNTGFYSGPIDGILGPVSRKAIKDFQILHELVGDGIVGPQTWASLRLYLDSK